MACTGFAALGLGAVVFNKMEPSLIGKQELRLTGVAVRLADAPSSPGATQGAHAITELPDIRTAPKDLPPATERVVLSSQALDDFAVLSNPNAKDGVAIASRTGDFTGADEGWSEGDVRGVDSLAGRFGQYLALARRTEESLFVVAIVEVDPVELSR